MPSPLLIKKSLKANIYIITFYNNFNKKTLQNTLNQNDLTEKKVKHIA